MKKLHTVLTILSALLVTFLISTGLHDDLLGKALATAMLPQSETAALEVPVVQAATADATASLPAEEDSYEARFQAKVGIDHVSKIPVLPPTQVDSETLWLARGIFSETKRPDEQELVAWVIRNRVETQYRGEVSYKGVVLDPYQFSAFIAGSSSARYYSNLQPGDSVPGWAEALRIAHFVRHAAPSDRPFSLSTRHFYSEQSMVGHSHPAWASGRHPVKPARAMTLDARRFRFYDTVS